MLNAIYAALIVWVAGLAVPVTASYIICAAVAAPALIELGVPDYAVHICVFYYAVLSEVSPPTALPPFADSTITGGGRIGRRDGVEIHVAGLRPAVRVRDRSSGRRTVAAVPAGHDVG